MSRTLTPQDVALIQDSFARLAPHADALAQDFYRRVFQLAPNARPLFKNDMTDQREKLIATLAYVVRGLGDLKSIESAVRALGRRHRGYNVKPEHYDVVGRALLDALAARSGSSWSPAVKDAWSKAYGLLARIMIDAQESVDAT